jgi:Ca-activated chloride channel homolog
MRLRNDFPRERVTLKKLFRFPGVASAALVLLCAGMLPAQAPIQGPPQAQEPPAQQQPAPSQSTTQGDAPNQPGNTVQVPAKQQQGQELEREGDQGFIIRKNVQEVQLHATVVDDKRHVITDLGKQDFAVFENGQPQTISSFHREDIPVSIGIIIDNSGSMRDKRPAVNQAALNFVRASRPDDEVFIVNFNDEYYLDQDFTADLGRLKEGMEKIDSRGGTALYDAVVASADHLKRGAKLEKRVLLVVTDGEDNASRESLEQATRRLEQEDGPTVYTIGLLGEERQKRARRALQVLADRTGGVSFFPKDLNEVDSITKEVAHDIRNQYTIGYKPVQQKSEGGYRTVRVEAKAPGHGKLFVRTRTGYYAGQERASSGQ